MMKNRTDHTTAVVAGAVSLVAIIALLLLGLEYEHSQNTATLATAIIAFAGMALTGVLSLVKLGDIQATGNRIDKAVNGELDGRIEAAVERVWEKRSQAPPPAG